MLEILLILAGLGLMGFSGLPAALLPFDRTRGQRLTVALLLAGSLPVLVGAARSLSLPATPTLIRDWSLPWGRFAVAVDPLGAFFLIIISVIAALGAIYGLAYWRAAEHPDSCARLGFFYGLLAGSMGLVVIARDAVFFLIVWEIMALSSWFAAAVEDENPEVQKAGWVYLVATHVGTLVLLAMFGLWMAATHDSALVPAVGLSPELAGTIFVLALIGFGCKAGIMPLHVWLPGAHANAPSQVSALMSGVMLKLGIFGIIRIVGLLGEASLWWGGLLLLVGGVSGIWGITLALGQRDLKRVLAYSSIENLGIITLALGLGLIGRALDRPELVLLGLGGAVFHILNHALFKSLLFFNAGAIIHATHTRDLERLGGLAGKMPVCAGLFLVGAVAICALPPLNGFAGEWLIYLGLFKTVLEPASVTGAALAAGGAVALAMIGALAGAAFVRLYGIVFLGAARSPDGLEAHDPGPAMTLAMLLPALACVLLGGWPPLFTPLLEKVVRVWLPPSAVPPSLVGLVPQFGAAGTGIGLLLIAAGLWLWQYKLAAGRQLGRGLTWDCGYARPTARMQYTGLAFAQFLVALFAFVLKPRDLVARRPLSPFPGPGEFLRQVPDLVLDRLVYPLFRLGAKIIPRAYVFQHGQTHFYVLYVLLVSVALFVFGIGVFYD